LRSPNSPSLQPFLRTPRPNLAQPPSNPAAGTCLIPWYTSERLADAAAPVP